MDQEKLILLVSQYDPHRILYSSAIEDAGYSVLTANTGRSAAVELRKVGCGGVDLIVMGSRLLAGVEELEQAIVSMGENAPPVIVHTAYSDPKSLYKGKPLEPHIKGYIVKSADTNQLIEEIRKALGEIQTQ